MHKNKVRSVKLHGLPRLTIVYQWHSNYTFSTIKPWLISLRVMYWSTSFCHIQCESHSALHTFLCAFQVVMWGYSKLTQEHTTSEDFQSGSSIRAASIVLLPVHSHKLSPTKSC